MNINAAALQSIYRAIVTAFQAGETWRPPVALDFLMRDYTSTSRSNFYVWLAQNPGFRKWVGDRHWNNCASNAFELVNDDFERSDIMPANAISDDTYSIYVQLFESYGAAWVQMKYKIAIDVILANPLCFTGKAFFADDHAYGANTIDNLTSSALSKSSFQAAFLAASEWKYANGELIRPSFSHLLVGEKLRATAHSIVVAERMVDDNNLVVDNPNRGRCQMVVVPDFAGTYDDYWVLADCTGVVKPIARQIRKEAQPVMDTRVEEVEKTAEIRMFAHGRAAAGPSFPHLVYGGRL
jgi:phage major head subunit gpT-like protein